MWSGVDTFWLTGRHGIRTRGNSLHRVWCFGRIVCWRPTATLIKEVELTALVVDSCSGRCISVWSPIVTRSRLIAILLSVSLVPERATPSTSFNLSNFSSTSVLSSSSTVSRSLRLAATAHASSSFASFGRPFAPLSLSQFAHYFL